mmetsp:Transcript_56579/g.120153  ORF Transcript_56579/g.120153 Transcript_56579/m.120153 type:complete len:414 (-) Transcript_56579:388-1629(-)
MEQGSTNGELRHPLVAFLLLPPLVVEEVRRKVAAVVEQRAHGVVVDLPGDLPRPHDLQQRLLGRQVVGIPPLLPLPRPAVLLQVPPPPLLLRRLVLLLRASLRLGHQPFVLLLLLILEVVPVLRVEHGLALAHLVVAPEEVRHLVGGGGGDRRLPRPEVEDVLRLLRGRGELLGRGLVRQDERAVVVPQRVPDRAVEGGDPEVPAARAGVRRRAGERHGLILSRDRGPRGGPFRVLPPLGGLHHSRFRGALRQFRLQLRVQFRELFVLVAHVLGRSPSRRLLSLVHGIVQRPAHQQVDVPVRHGPRPRLPELVGRVRRRVHLLLQVRLVKLVQRHVRAGRVFELPHPLHDRDAAYFEHLGHVEVFPLEPVRPRRDEEGRGAHPRRSASRDDPVALHARDQAQGRQGHIVGFFV